MGFNFMVYAGVCGAMASILGKIAMTSTFRPTILVASAICDHIGMAAVDNCPNIAIVSIRALVGLSMLYVNALMLSYFLKSLESYGSLPVTVVCMGVNFITTGFLGYLILGEGINFQWISGACMIMIGVFFVLKSTKLSVSADKK